MKTSGFALFSRPPSLLPSLPPFLESPKGLYDVEDGVGMMVGGREGGRIETVVIMLFIITILQKMYTCKTRGMETQINGSSNVSCSRVKDSRERERERKSSGCFSLAGEGLVWEQPSPPRLSFILVIVFKCSFIFWWGGVVAPSLSCRGFSFLHFPFTPFSALLDQQTCISLLFFMGRKESITLF